MLGFILVGVAVVVLLLGFPVVLCIVLFSKEDQRVFACETDELARRGIRGVKLKWVRK